MGRWVTCGLSFSNYYYGIFSINSVTYCMIQVDNVTLFYVYQTFCINWAIIAKVQLQNKYK